MSRRKKGGGGGEDCGSWMDTYGDMVTLLLCFFVLLYSMSSLDQQKWEIFVKSIFPSSDEEEQIAINENIEEGEYDVSGVLQMDEEPEIEDLDQLYLTLVERLQENGMVGEGVSVSRGEGYTFIAFENQAFFNGDSSILTEEAKEVLDVFCEILAPETDKISQIEILGHTSQANPDRPNNPRTDRLLSSMRSAEVAAYIQEKDIIDPSKLVGISYGQFRPVDTVETREGRAKNRRVEFLIVDQGADIKSMNEYYDEIYGIKDTDSTGTAGEDVEGFAPADGASENGASMLPDQGAEGAAEPITPADGTTPVEPATPAAESSGGTVPAPEAAPTE